MLIYKSILAVLNQKKLRNPSNMNLLELMTRENSLNMVHLLTRQADSCANSPSGYSEKLEKHKKAASILREILKEEQHDQAVRVALKHQLEMHDKEVSALELFNTARERYEAELREKERRREQERIEREERQKAIQMNTVKQPDLTCVSDSNAEGYATQISRLTAQVDKLKSELDERRKNEELYNQQIYELSRLAKFLRDENERLRAALRSHRTYADSGSDGSPQGDALITEQSAEARSRNNSQNESGRTTQSNRSNEALMKRPMRAEMQNEELSQPDADDDLDLPPTQMHIANS